jgi:Arc/MetJ family transcription regulator
VKRKNVMVDEALLLEAKQMLKADSASATINQALADAIMVARIRRLGTYLGSGVWDGNLGEMREDHGTKRKNRKTS